MKEIEEGDTSDIMFTKTLLLGLNSVDLDNMGSYTHQKDHNTTEHYSVNAEHFESDNMSNSKWTLVLVPVDATI